MGRTLPDALMRRWRSRRANVNEEYAGGGGRAFSLTLPVARGPPGAFEAGHGAASSPLGMSFRLCRWLSYRASVNEEHAGRGGVW